MDDVDGGDRYVVGGDVPVDAYARIPTPPWPAARSSDPRPLVDDLEHLGALAATGDPDAMHRLLEAIRPRIVRYCRARIGTGVGLTTADDIAQEVTLAVCTALGAGRYRAGAAGLMAWVHGITAKKVVDALRSAGRDRSEPADWIPDEADLAAGPEHRGVLLSEIDELRSMLDELPTYQREVLVLRIAMGMSAAETATLLSSTPGAVRVAQHRAMQRLRALIAARRAAERDQGN